MTPEQRLERARSIMEAAFLAVEECLGVRATMPPFAHPGPKDPFRIRSSSVRLECAFESQSESWPKQVGDRDIAGILNDAALPSRPDHSQAGT